MKKKKNDVDVVITQLTISMKETQRGGGNGLRRLFSNILLYSHVKSNNFLLRRFYTFYTF
jgi:hypothetical protein